MTDELVTSTAPDSGPEAPDSSEISAFDEFVADDTRESRKAFEPEADADPTEATQNAGDDSADASAEQPVVVQQPVKFTFAGREYDSQEAAENAFKSFDGRIRAVNQRVTDSEAEIRQWREWYEYERGRGNIDDQGNITRQATPEPKAGGETKTAGGKEPFLEAIDWNLVGNYAQEHGVVPALKVAILQLQDHFQGNVLKDIDGRFENLTAPQREYREAERMVGEATDWLYKAVMRVDPESGAPLHPKLNEHAPTFDPAYSQVFIDTWMNVLKQQPQLALSQDGIDWVSWKADQLASAATQKTVTAREVAQNVGRAANGQFVKASKAKAGIDSGKKPAASATELEGAPADDEAETIRKGIKSAGIADRDTAKLLGIG